MAEPKIRAAGYVRVSTAKQVEGESLDTQRKQIRAFIETKEAKGWKLTKIYSDEGASGKDDFAPFIRDFRHQARREAGPFAGIDIGIIPPL